MIELSFSDRGIYLKSNIIFYYFKDRFGGLFNDVGSMRKNLKYIFWCLFKNLFGKC